jgi:sensor histidine kinase YesM
LKKNKERKTNGKSKHKTSKPKKTGNKINGKKQGTSKRGKKWKKMDSSICIFFAFILFFRFVLFLLLFCFIFVFYVEKNRKKTCKWTTPFFFHFFSLFVFPFFSFFFLAFVFLAFFFQVLRKNRINYGLADIMLAFRSRPLGRGYI